MSLFLLIGKLFRQPTFKAIALHCFVSVPNYQRFWIEKILKKNDLLGADFVCALASKSICFESRLDKNHVFDNSGGAFVYGEGEKGEGLGRGFLLPSLFSP